MIEETHLGRLGPKGGILGQEGSFSGPWRPRIGLLPTVGIETQHSMVEG